ncbi:hypothetical protein KCP77_08020 [Salmonella enterica subsp. enterica]|nr:hypothetical protein KCP77_08020 [Salmonella enterica subsp. enterica]
MVASTRCGMICTTNLLRRSATGRTLLTVPGLSTHQAGLFAAFVPSPSRLSTVSTPPPLQGPDWIALASAYTVNRFWRGEFIGSRRGNGQSLNDAGDAAAAHHHHLPSLRRPAVLHHYQQALRQTFHVAVGCQLLQIISIE